jgi:hypothetical protein
MIHPRHHPHVRRATCSCQPCCQTLVAPTCYSVAAPALLAFASDKHSNPIDADENIDSAEKASLGSGTVRAVSNITLHPNQLLLTGLPAACQTTRLRAHIQLRHHFRGCRSAVLHPHASFKLQQTDAQPAAVNHLHQLLLLAVAASCRCCCGHACSQLAATITQPPCIACASPTTTWHDTLQQ